MKTEIEAKREIPRLPGRLVMCPDGRMCGVCGRWIASNTECLHLAEQGGVFVHTGCAEVIAAPEGM